MVGFFEVNNYNSLISCLEEVLNKINKNQIKEDLFKPRARIMKKFTNEIFLKN